MNRLRSFFIAAISLVAPALDAAPMTGNTITANGTYTVVTRPGRTYAFSVAGSFGGGSLAINWRDDNGNTAPYTESPAAAAEYWTFTATTNQLDLVLTGATAPSLTLTIAPADGKLVEISGVSGLTAALASKQPTLVSGGTIKTVNGFNLLGSGNIDVSGTVAFAPFLVTSYGADKTGATDSSAAIAAAFTAASSGNRHVHFPRGTYKFNYALTGAMASGHWKITGDGGGMTGDWTAVEPPPATMCKPNNNSLPVFTFEFIRGITMQHIEIRGNGAGVSSDGILIDNPFANFAGNGFYAHNMTIRAFTNGFRCVGGCNIVFRESILVNSNYQVKIPNLPLAHSYLFEQCSLGGLATVLGGSGTSRILDVADGSFIELINCEMGNCTDMIATYATGAPIINVRGGNMESMSASVLNLMQGGTFNMSGVRISTGNKTVVRGDGGPGEILGVSLENNNAQGTMTMYDHRGAVANARLSGNGTNKLVSEYNSDFTVLQGTSVCERLAVAARLTADQVIAGAGTTTVVFNVETADVGSKHNTTTGEFAPGKRGIYSITGGIAVSTGTAMPKLGVYVNGSLRGILGQAITGGSGTFVGGNTVKISVAAADVITVRVVTTAGMTILSDTNYSSTLSIEEQSYWTN